MGYKWCAVPECKNTSIKTPDKIFICVPKQIKMRKKWLELARRDPRDIEPNSVIFFCEDHFDMEKDIQNYHQYKMGFSQRIIMVNNIVPSKLKSQLDQYLKKCDNGGDGGYVKPQRKRIVYQSDSEGGPAEYVINATDGKCNECKKKYVNGQYWCLQCDERLKCACSHTEHFMLRLPVNAQQTDCVRVLDKLRRSLDELGGLSSQLDNSNTPSVAHFTRVKIEPLEESEESPGDTQFDMSDGCRNQDHRTHESESQHDRVSLQMASTQSSIKVEPNFIEIKVEPIEEPEQGEVSLKYEHREENQSPDSLASTHKRTSNLHLDSDTHKRARIKH